jgi:hypothetical protein
MTGRASTPHHCPTCGTSEPSRFLGRHRGCVICRLAPPPRKIISPEKRCRGRCGQVKPLRKYHINRDAFDRHASTCAECVNRGNRETYRLTRRKQPASAHRGT